MLSVTSAAQAKLLEVMQRQEQPLHLVRIDVVRGPHGCVHGWRLGLEQAEGSDDSVVQAGRLHLVMEKELAPMLEGASIDYVEGPRGIGFVIDAAASEDGHDGGHHCHHQ